MQMHIYSSSVVHIPKLANVSSILWPQQLPQDFEGQGHISKVKGHRGKMNANAHPPLMGSPHTQNGTGAINALDTARGTKLLTDGQKDRRQDRQAK